MTAISLSVSLCVSSVTDALLGRAAITALHYTGTTLALYRSARIGSDRIGLDWLTFIYLGDLR